MGRSISGPCNRRHLLGLEREYNVSLPRIGSSRKCGCIIIYERGTIINHRITSHDTDIISFTAATPTLITCSICTCFDTRRVVRILLGHMFGMDVINDHNSDTS